MLYDIHAHLDYFKDEEIEELVKNAEKANLRIIIGNSTDLESCKKSLEISKKYKIVKFAAGLYPNPKLTKKNLEEFEDFVLKNKKEIVAIGEIGMDFKEFPLSSKNNQKKVFEFQLKLAQKLSIPIIIHSRKAEKEVIEILKNYPKVKKIMHCFSAKFKLIREANEIGCYFSIPPNVVRSEHFQKMVKELPKEKMLLETDSPYLSPFPGKQNQPAYAFETVKMISLLWKMPVEGVEKILWENYERVF
ncbi:MAG: TatD family hydrolase [Nanoarchaeota archaeon]|nr:TatD family hydrolase [Nanoarchaeota archaeon]